MLTQAPSTEPTIWEVGRKGLNPPQIIVTYGSWKNKNKKDW